MKKRFRESGILDKLVGAVMDILPLVCAFFIVTWAGRAYAEGYGLFVQKPLDKSAEAHTEMVTITQKDADSALAVGTILENQHLIGSRFAFALKSRLSGYDGTILPGTYILSSDMTAEELLRRISVKPGTDPASQGENTEAQSPEGGAEEGRPAAKENKDVWGQ